MKRTAFAVCFLVFIWQVYRAAATPVTDLEAVTYNGFVSQAPMQIFTLPYNPANQILHSLLCGVAIQTLRLTEFVLRIPSLLGLLLYFWAALRLFSPLSKLRFWFFCVFVVNPLTIGWIPQSTGFWMASGFFLIGLRSLAQFRGDLRSLAFGSLAFGLAGGFYIQFLFVEVTAILVFLHFEFWGARRLTLSATVNNVVLPAVLIWFCVWSLSLIRAETLSLGNLLPNPGIFTVASAPNLPSVARELRNDIRKHPPRSIRVAASASLANRLNFYRHRYALGAVQQILPLSSSGLADYTIEVEPQTGRAKLKPTTLVEMHQ